MWEVIKRRTRWRKVQKETSCPNVCKESFLMMYGTSYYENIFYFTIYFIIIVEKETNLYFTQSITVIHIIFYYIHGHYIVLKK